MTGKTTLIKAILGLIEDYEGEIIMHNTKIGYLPQKHRILIKSSSNG